MLPGVSIAASNVAEPAGLEPAKLRLGPLGIWLIAALGAALRLVWLGHKSFWLDEIASLVIAGLPRRVFWWTLWHNEGNMSLYYLLLRPWLHWGLSEANARVLSVIPGIASIPIMYALGKRLFGRRTGTLAALFLALNACSIATSQEARAYSLLVLGVTLSTYLFVRLIEQPTSALACAYGAVAGLTFYCHYFGLLVPAAHAVSLLALPRRKLPWRQLIFSAVLIAVTAAPVLWMIHIQDIGHLAWLQSPSWLEFYHLGAYLAAGNGKVLGAILLLLDLALLVLFWRALRKNWPAYEHDLLRWRYVLAASSLVTPVLIALLVSARQPVFYHRFLIIILPAWVLMSAVGAREIGSRRWRTLAIAAVAALSLANTVLSYTRVQEDWRGVARYLTAKARAGDRVVYYEPVGYFAVENYRNWLPAGSASRPLGVMANPPDESWRKQLDGAARVWLVLYRAKPDQAAAVAIIAQLRSQYAEGDQVKFRAVTVIAYTARH
jgi:mannosyltransferase